jgi:hypothetical protein
MGPLFGLGHKPSDGATMPRDDNGFAALDLA